MTDSPPQRTHNQGPLSRLASIDAYRGFVMLLLLGEAVHLRQMAENFPKSATWRFLAHHQTHVEWRGCSLHDTIQPSFSFLVGAALPFSLAARKRKGESTAKSILHALWRAFVLVFLGVFLRSMHSPRTNFTFEDTLSQIGLGYFPLFLLGLARPRARWIALVLILVGYWATFALYPLPGKDFDYESAGVRPDWKHNAQGFPAHWNKNTSAARAFDVHFLNLFPRPNDKPYKRNDGGYATLSFIPTLATMLLGLIAGGWLIAERPGWKKLAALIAAGAVSLALGLALDHFGICPSVKRIWTPAWVLVSGGICFFMLAGFYLSTDLIGFSGWAYPLRVIGANSIAAYVMAHVLDGFIVDSFHIHLGAEIFKRCGDAYEPLCEGLAVVLVEWLILFWMYRRRILLRI